MVGWWFRRAFWCNINSGNDMDEVWLMLQLFWSYGETVRLLLTHSYSFQCNEKWSPQLLQIIFLPNIRSHQTYFTNLKHLRPSDQQQGESPGHHHGHHGVPAGEGGNPHSFPAVPTTSRHSNHQGFEPSGGSCDGLGSGQPPNPSGKNITKQTWRLYYSTIISGAILHNIIPH